MDILKPVKKIGKHKRFLREQLDRYEEAMDSNEVGSKEYEALRESHSKMYDKLYPNRHIADKLLTLFGIVMDGAKIGTGIALAKFAFSENEKLNSKDRDVWSIAQKFLRF